MFERLKLISDCQRGLDQGQVDEGLSRKKDNMAHKLENKDKIKEKTM